MDQRGFLAADKRASAIFNGNSNESPYREYFAPATLILGLLQGNFQRLIAKGYSARM
jgi:hypothetical protein